MRHPRRRVESLLPRHRNETPLLRFFSLAGLTQNHLYASTKTKMSPPTLACVGRQSCCVCARA